MNINTGEIILIPFPYTDLTSQKTRPALVIHSGKRENDVIILAITSKPGETRLLIQSKNLAQGKLPIDSFVRYNKIATLSKKLIKRRVAVLNEATLHEVVTHFKQQF